MVGSLSMTSLGATTPTTLPYRELMFINYGLGVDLACSEIQDLVKDVQKELGMDGYVIEVRKLSEKGLKQHSPGCAFGRTHVFLDEEQLLEMSRDEQRFLIGHELVHIRNNHKKKEKILENFISYGGTALSYAAVGLMLKDQWPYLSRTGRDDAVMASLAVAFVGSFTAFFIGACCNSSFGRSHEEEADCYAAHELHCALGGCYFFFKEMFKRGDVSLKGGLFDSHPKVFKRFLNLVMISGDTTLYDLVFERGDKTAEVYVQDIMDYLEEHVA